jgi:hypothetical protein
VQPQSCPGPTSCVRAPTRSATWRSLCLAALDGCREAARSRGHFERVDEQGSSQPPLFPDEHEARFERRKSSPFAAEHEGFSVHAGVSLSALDRKGRERLVHYCVRPPVALGRLSIVRDGSVAIGSRPTCGCP